MMNLPTGKEGCQCTDKSSLLASLHRWPCLTSDGENGVLISTEGPCVPHSYGSGGCLRHDLIHNPECEMADSGHWANNSDYCLRPWCYVDAATCRQSSFERVYRSDYFPHQDLVSPRHYALRTLFYAMLHASLQNTPNYFVGFGVQFYSYSTCGSSADDWKQYLQEQTISLSTIVPTYSAPLMYKRSPSGDILTSDTVGAEYYNSSVPFEGVFVNYLDNLMSIADADLNINYTFGSKAGRRVYSSTKYTAAIQDIQDGLADMAIGSFWVTGQRLRITSFTIPLYYDKTVLVIPKPGDNSSLNAQTSKVLEPFTMAMWVLIILLITFTAVLSVWFSMYGRDLRQGKRPERLKKSGYVRVALDEFLQKGMFFCSAGVNQDTGANLPQKLLMFGFGFFILIVVSAYVANLAAFLTRPVDFVGTIEKVNHRGMKVCAHPALKTELQVAWPTVNFVFSEASYSGMLEGFDKGKCDVLAVGESDILSGDYTVEFCKRGLVLTDSLIIETAVAFPIRHGLASGLSYWMQVGEKNHGITVEAAQEEYDKKYSRQPFCKLEFSLEEHEASDYDRIEPQNSEFEKWKRESYTWKSFRIRKTIF
ncbi:hypothetical protein ACHAXR_005246 [Thalassiosira sp. AJA248-18]